MFLGASLACDYKETGKPVPKPYWTFTQDLKDGHHYSASFYSDANGQISMYSTMTTLPSGKQYLDSGAPSAEDIKALIQVTSSTSIESLGSNFELTNTEVPTQPGMALISFGPHDCVANCSQMIGIVKMKPNNPNVNAMMQFFSAFVISHRGREATNWSSKGK